MKITTAVTDLGSDVLEVVAEDDDGNEVRAYGWVSATSNHYPPDAYDAETGHVREDVQPRAMTAEEVGAYARALIEGVQPSAPATPRPVPYAD